MTSTLFLITVVWQIHAKGSRHGDAFSRLKERDLSRQEELNKRIALSSDSVTTSSSTTVQVTRTKVCNQPLIEQTRKAIFEAQCNRSWDQIAKVGSSAQKVNTLSFPCDSKILRSPHLVIEPPIETRFEEPPKTKERRSVVVTEAASKILVDWNDELRKQREKELKFIAAGWKRDGFGKWYKDETVSSTFFISSILILAHGVRKVFK